MAASGGGRRASGKREGHQENEQKGRAGQQHRDRVKRHGLEEEVAKPRLISGRDGYDGVASTAATGKERVPGPLYPAQDSAGSDTL